MKKIISLITGILISTTLISCSGTKILEENTKENNESNKYIITERNIENPDNDNRFMPMFYDKDILYGNMFLKRGEYTDKMIALYYLDNEGEFKKVEEEKFTNDELGFLQDNIQHEGVYMADSNKLSERKFYYMDLIDKTKFELNEFEKVYSNIEYKLKRFISYGFKLHGNSNYYIQNYSYSENNLSYQADELIIIDIKNEKYYGNNNDNKFINFFYDNNENSIMAINNQGKIYKIIIEGNNLTYELYKDIGLDNLNVYDKYVVKMIDNTNEGFILEIENNENKGYGDYYYILYNYKTSEIISLDKEKTILGNLKNTNFHIVLYKKIYLAEITDDGDINLIYKLDNDDGYKYCYSLANENGDSIFIARGKFSAESIKNPEKPIVDEEIKYSILEIKER